MARALVSTTAGKLWLIERDSASSALALVTTGEIPEATFGGVDVTEDGLIVVAGGSDGLFPFRIVGDSLEPLEPSKAAKDARDTEVIGGNILVADGTFGIKLLSTDLSETLATLERPGEVHHVVVEGHVAVALRGHRGFDLLRVADDTLEVLDSATPDGVALDAIVRGKELFVVLGHAVQRYSVVDGTLSVLAQEWRPGRLKLVQPWFLSGAKMDDGSTFVALGSEIVPAMFHDFVATPDVQAVTASLLMRVNPGSPARARIYFRNVGTADAIVSGVVGDSGFDVEIREENLLPTRAGCPGQSILEPGQEVPIHFERELEDGASLVGRISIQSNDPDGPLASGLAVVNRSIPGLGTEGAELSMVTWKGEPYRLRDQRGDVVFLKLVAPS